MFASVGTPENTMTATSRKRITEQIKAKALSLGFAKVGIARAERLTEDSEHLMEWLYRGYHGTMEWMSRNIDKRVDPQEILPNAQSIISVAMNYFTQVDENCSVSHRSDTSTPIRISRYAWGDDYHDIVSERLEQLQHWLSDLFPDSESRIYVDTGPVMEKVWAARSGIGWQGKHTNIISREFGSWIFLGEILTTLELEYDAPALDHCGTCTRCIEACPTNAIVAPYVLNASQCISYLTIEHRGELPDHLSRKLQSWVFGCDICQDVCPWNRFAKITQEPAFQPREAILGLTAEEALSLSEEEFRHRFQRSSVRRTKYAGFLRNVRAALNKSRTSEDVA